MESNKNKLIWNIEPKGMPLIIRNCNKCNEKREFYCSELFRVNAQKKSIDIWLIYKCNHCDSTYNLPIYSRIPPNSLKGDLQKRFENNDRELVWEYAFNSDILKRNNAEVKYEIDYVVHGIKADMEFNGQVHILIKCPYNVNLRLNKFLQKQLGIQRKIIDELIEDKAICLKGNADIKKYRIKEDLEIWINYKKVNEIIKNKNYHKIKENNIIICTNIYTG